MHFAFLANIDHSILCNTNIFNPIVSTISILICFISWILFVQITFVYFELL